MKKISIYTLSLIVFTGSAYASSNNDKKILEFKKGKIYIYSQKESIKPKEERIPLRIIVPSLNDPNSCFNLLGAATITTKAGFKDYTVKANLCLSDIRGNLKGKIWNSWDSKCSYSKLEKDGYNKFVEIKGKILKDNTFYLYESKEYGNGVYKNVDYQTNGFYDGIYHFYFDGYTDKCKNKIKSYKFSFMIK